MLRPATPGRVRVVCMQALAPRTPHTPASQPRPVARPSSLPPRLRAAQALAQQLVGECGAGGAPVSGDYATEMCRWEALGLR